jgi:hypothetical protein
VSPVRVGPGARLTQSANEISITLENLFLFSR